MKDCKCVSCRLWQHIVAVEHLEHQRGILIDQRAPAKILAPTRAALRRHRKQIMQLLIEEPVAVEFQMNGVHLF